MQWKNPRKLFCGYPQTDSKMYTGRQRTQYSQNYIKEEQNWGTYYPISRLYN